MDNGKIHVLIRTSERERLFRNCIESVIATGKDVKVLVSADTEGTEEYANRILAESGLDFEVVRVEKGSGYGYWNLYLNDLIALAGGWIYILDDDKVVTDLNFDLRDKNTVYIYKIDYVDRELPEPEYWGGITACHVDMANFVFHKEGLKTKFDGKGRADYRFLHDLSTYRSIEWVDKVIAKVDTPRRGTKDIEDITIDFVVPYAFDKNLGRVYNMIMERSDADYVCLMDGDIMFLHNDFGHHIANVIRRYPDGGIYTCLTNRIGNPEQRFEGKISTEKNILRHKKIAEHLRKRYGYKAVKATSRTSMLLSVISRKVWEEFRFKDGLMGVDWDFSSRVMEKYPVYIMQGLYVFHLYRLGDGGVNYTDHLK